MQVRHVRSILMAVVAAACFVGVSGCNNNDDGGDIEQTSEIRGTVIQVVEAMHDTGAPSTRFARLKEFLTLVRTAHAQTPGVAGIVVSVLLDGVTLDTDETDEAGNFVLNVDAGSLVLTFTAENFSVSLNLTVASNSGVTLEVSLHPNQATEVVIEAMETLQDNPEGPVSCEHGTLTLAAEQVNGVQSNIEIDGDGKVCMHTESGCHITTQEGMTADITMINCQECIRTEGDSSISIETAGSIICDEARGDGVRTESGSRIELVAGHMPMADGAMADAMPAAGATIDISAAQDGIRTEGMSSAILTVEGTSADDPAPSISVVGGSTGIRTEGASTAALSVMDATGAAMGSIAVAGGDIGGRAEAATVVSLVAGTCTIEGADEAMRTEGEGIIDVMCSAPPEM